MLQEKGSFAIEAIITKLSEADMARIFDQFIELVEEVDGSVGGGYHREGSQFVFDVVLENVTGKEAMSANVFLWGEPMKFGGRIGPVSIYPVKEEGDG